MTPAQEAENRGLEKAAAHLEAVADQITHSWPANAEGYRAAAGDIRKMKHIDTRPTWARG